MITKKFIGICLVFLALPFIINSLSYFNAPFELWSKPSEWTTFWGQYLSGFAAFAMLYVAWKTLLTTKEANRPYVVLDIVDRGMSRVYIRCRNIGHSTATDVKITLSQEFINLIKIDKVKETLQEINNSAPFVLEPKGEKIWELLLIPGIQLDSLNNTFGKDAKYSFKGEYILKSLWQENEAIFKSNVIKANVSYNSEYKDVYNIDYNNLLDGISPDKRIADQIFSVSFVLSKIQWDIEKIKEKVNGTETK